MGEEAFERDVCFVVALVGGTAIPLNGFVDIFVGSVAMLIRPAHIKLSWSDALLSSATTPTDGLSAILLYSFAVVIATS